LTVEKVDPKVAIQDHLALTSSVYYPSSTEASGALRMNHEFGTDLRTALEEYNKHMHYYLFQLQYPKLLICSPNIVGIFALENEKYLGSMKVKIVKSNIR